METPLQYGYYMPKFTDNCFGCGRCEKACRANALKFEEMPNGQTRMVLTPWKCSECGVCMNVCSNKGFDGMKLYQLTTLGPVVLHKCTKTLCKQCGKPIAPDSAEGLCSVCRIKARTLKRQEEARQRAEQLKAERAAKAAEEAGADYVGAEELVAKIQGENWFDFDVVVATPNMMGVVGRLGRVLGPKGLMPSPKAGTVTMDVAKAVNEAKAGKVEYRLDKQAIIHCPIGKKSFTAEQLTANLTALMNAINRAKPAAAKGIYLRSVVLSSTMGPGIKVNPLKF